MPFLGNMQVVAVPTMDKCAEQGCPMSPDKLYRISVSEWNFYLAGLCKLHSYGVKRIPAGYIWCEISRDEWIVWEVMGS